MKIKVSIIVPVYNAEKYLKNCIESLMSQTYKNTEIILINDGSKDNSLNICKEYAEKDERIKIVDQLNQGPSEARNNGIKNASGDYILFVDSDDWLEKQTVDELIKRDSKDMILFASNLVKNNIKDVRTFILQDGTYDLSKDRNILRYLFISERINSVWGKIYNRQTINDNNILFDKNIPIAEDLLFNVKYVEHINYIQIYNKALYNYRCDNNVSLSKKYNPSKFEHLMYVDDKIEDIIKEYKYNDNYKEIIQFIRFKNISSCILDLYRKECKYSKKEKIDFIKSIKNKYNSIIINNVSFSFLLISIIYSIFSPNILLYVYKIIYQFKIRMKGRKNTK